MSRRQTLLMSDAIQITIHVVEYMEKSIELITELEKMEMKAIPVIQIIFRYRHIIASKRSN